jgi:hypothetical protein
VTSSRPYSGQYRERMQVGDRDLQHFQTAEPIARIIDLQLLLMAAREVVVHPYTQHWVFEVGDS